MPTAALTAGTSAPASSAYRGAAPSATSLQAQLERYQQQLSDCVNCASAKTPQGKADIQAISARISQIEQRIAQTENRRAEQPAPSPSTPGVGGLIDVFA